MLDIELMSKIARRSRYRKDYCCAMCKGVAYRVASGSPTHVAYDGFVFELKELEGEVKIGVYNGDIYAARRALKSIKTKAP